MKRKFLCKLLFLLSSCWLYSQNNDGVRKDVEQLMENMRDAVNLNNYEFVQPYLSNSTSIGDMNPNTSLLQFYSYISSEFPHKIRDIEVKEVTQTNDSIFQVRGEKYLVNGSTQPIEFSVIRKPERLILHHIDKFFPSSGDFITRATYVNEDIFGDNPVENIKNLKVLDKSRADSISGAHYRVYYDNASLKQMSILALSMLEKLDSLLLGTFGFKEVEQDNLFLHSINSNNTIVVGSKHKDIPWTLALYQNESANLQKLKEKIATTYSHEITEGSLVWKYKLFDEYKFRWFRDGLAEFVAYSYAQQVDPSSANKYFCELRLSEAEKFKQMGHLLDWRAGSGDIAYDKGKLYGNKYIHDNMVGQYGRAFKFFLDLFEGKEEQIGLILKAIEEAENLQVKDLLLIMGQVTGRDVEVLIGEY